MKNLTKLFSLLLVILVMTACNNEKSLQGYLVESQDKAGFISVDVPTSFLQLKNDNVSEDIKSTLKSIRKINMVALPISGNEDAYEVEKNKIKNILNDNDTYKSLMTMKAKGMNVKVYYSGGTDAIDEIIAFGYTKKMGVGIARLLGDDMNPAKVMEMMNNIKIDTDNLNLEQLSAVFKEK